MLRKLGAFPRQDGLALALRELGRLERSLFTLQYLKGIELRRRIHAGLNKGEARNALARAVFFNRLGELRDRTYENQRHRASGLNLVVAAIVLRNTVYLECTVKALRERGEVIPDALVAHLSPLGWEHINLTGDDVWKPGTGTRRRPLRQLRLPIDADEPSPSRTILSVPRSDPYQPGPRRELVPGGIVRPCRACRDGDSRGARPTRGRLEPRSVGG